MEAWKSSESQALQPRKRSGQGSRETSRSRRLDSRQHGTAQTGQTCRTGQTGAGGRQRTTRPQDHGTTTAGTERRKAESARRQARGPKPFPSPHPHSYVVGRGRNFLCAARAVPTPSPTRSGGRGPGRGGTFRNWSYHNALARFTGQPPLDKTAARTATGCFR